MLFCKQTHIKPPSNIVLQDRYWYVHKGAHKGGFATLKKYGVIGGNQQHRKRCWYKWWELKGKYKTHAIHAPKPFRKPRHSEELAEFVGIMLGDGGISQYQITVTLHSQDDKKYGIFVNSLIQKLFDVPVGEYRSKKDLTISYVVSRTALVGFCIEELGLKQGDKVRQQVDVPLWIKRNKKYSIACVRGLIDTDGSVFTHRYKVGGTWYSYKKLSFTNHSKPLLSFVYDVCKKRGLHPRLARSKDVRIDSVESMNRYFQIIGSHNPKHLKRYRN